MAASKSYGRPILRILKSLLTNGIAWRGPIPLFTVPVFRNARCPQPRREAVLPQFERGHYLALYHQARRVVFAASKAAWQRDQRRKGLVGHLAAG